MAQGKTTHEHGYTTGPYQGRELGSLTDDEIRDIAEKALLTALRGATLLSLAPLREQILLGNGDMNCPDCGTAMQRVGRCFTCPVCGHSHGGCSL